MIWAKAVDNRGSRKYPISLPAQCWMAISYGEEQHLSPPQLPRQRPKCIYATQACERESSMNNAAATAARNIRTDALILNDVETFMAVSEHFR